MMPTGLASLVQALKQGFVDPAEPDRLPAELRGEAGLLVVTWLLGAGIGPEALAEVRDAFRRHDGLRGELPWPQFVDRMQTLSYAVAIAPALVVTLQEALRRVDSPAQWEGFLRFLDRTTELAALQAGRFPAR